MPRFALSRTALQAVFPAVTAATLQSALANGGPELEAHIISQQLAPLWHERTRAIAFAGVRLNATMVYMRQEAAVQEIDALFERAGICYALIKGVANRELTYDDPSLRPCSDIDVLVEPHQRVEAARVLVESGYRLTVDPTVVSHEVVLSKGIVAVDLHWDILRPGRTRVPVVDGMLSRRTRQKERWILSDADALFLMLVHAAITKHVSTSGMGLHRVADLATWWLRREVEWPAVRRHLDACGLKTAAWTVLTWVRMLSAGSELEAELTGPIESLHPGHLRAAYLRRWLDRDLSARLTERHAARLLGFSVFLHDGPTDAWHALQGWRRAGQTSRNDTRAFDGLIQ